jgi:hypothetical protein
VKTSDGEVIEKKADCKAEVAFSSWQRFWLVVAALWLQAVVVIFVFMQFKQHVHTPVSDWMSKIMHLFGE